MKFSFHVFLWIRFWNRIETLHILTDNVHNCNCFWNAILLGAQYDIESKHFSIWIILAQTRITVLKCRRDYTGSIDILKHKLGEHISWAARSFKIIEIQHDPIGRYVTVSNQIFTNIVNVIMKMQAANVFKVFTWDVVQIFKMCRPSEVIEQNIYSKV